MSLDLCKKFVFPQCLQNCWKMEIMKVVFMLEFGTYKIEVLEIYFIFR